MDKKAISTKIFNIPELAEKIFSLLSMQELCEARKVCRSWNARILPVWNRKASVRIGCGEYQLGKKEAGRLKSLITLLGKKVEFPLTKYHFGHLLDYDSLKKVWDIQGSRITHLAIDCHVDPEDLDATDEHLNFTSDHLEYIFYKCHSSLQNLRLNLPWEILESEFSNSSNYSMEKCRGLMICNAHSHNGCETYYPPIQKSFWDGFFQLFPSLARLDIRMDLNPKILDTFLPMLTSVKEKLPSSLSTLKLSVQICNSELEVLAKCNFGLKCLWMTRFHCTATGKKLTDLVKVHQSTLESLAIHVNIYYDSSEVEYEEWPEPEFGTFSLPSPMEKLRHLELSYNNKEAIHPQNKDALSKIHFYRIFCLERFNELTEPDFLDFMLPLNGTVFNCPQMKKVLITLTEEFSEKEEVEERVKIIFSHASIEWEDKRGDHSIIPYGIPLWD